MDGSNLDRRDFIEAVFTYGRGIAGRQVPGAPLPDHGKQEYDTCQFHGGNYATLHPRFYRDTPLKPADTKAPDFGDLDVLKMVMYHDCGGPRIASYVDSVSRTLYGDVPPAELLRFHYRVLNYDEAPYDQVRQAGLKHDYVFREAKRALEGAKGTPTLIYPGVDIDIPTGKNEAHSTPEDVRAAVKQAFRAGVPGILLSRKYSEMRLANLRAAGEAVKARGLA